MFTVPHFELWTSRFHDHLSNTLFVFLFLKDSADVWTPWSRCRRCVQSRERACDEPSRCGAVIRELRPCPGRRCGLKMRPSKPKTPGFRVLHHLQSLVYSDWSRWSPCTSECRTRRQRVCKMPMICGKTLVHEDALCYVRGTACETRYADTADPTETNLSQDKTQDKELSCGVPRSPNRPALRIIGGRPAARGRWPWQVSDQQYRPPF